MKKLSLRLDDLEIETFDPVTSAGERPGSVAAHQVSVLGPCLTYDPRDIHCAISRPYQPGGVCTPVCGETAGCILTEAC